MEGRGLSVESGGGRGGGRQQLTAPLARCAIVCRKMDLDDWPVEMGNKKLFDYNRVHSNFVLFDIGKRNNGIENRQKCETHRL